jgi:hypothetical protein
MRSWVKATNRPFLCGIKSGESRACYRFYKAIKSRDGTFVGYVAMKDFISRDFVFALPTREGRPRISL